MKMRIFAAEAPKKRNLRRARVRNPTVTRRPSETVALGNDWDSRTCSSRGWPMATLFDIDPATLGIGVRRGRDRFAVSSHDLACRHDLKLNENKGLKVSLITKGEGAKDLSDPP